MKRVWKYQLSLDQDYHKIEVPAGARFIMAAKQGGIPTVWALVDAEQPLEKRVLSIHGTGHGMPDNEEYIDSFGDGPFIWHVFEVRRR